MGMIYSKAFFFTIFGITLLSSGILSASAETYYAEIKNGVVSNVIVADKSFVDRMPGTWVQTYRDIPNKTFAGIGYDYNATAKKFAPEPLPPELIILNQFLKAQYEMLRASWLLPSNNTVGVNETG